MTLQGQPEMIQPQPAPETWICQPVDLADGRQIVRITIASISGTHVSFLMPEGAEAIAAQIVKVAKQAGSGIILPGNFPPHLNGHGGIG